MPDEKPAGAQPSLRDIAEAAYDDLEAGAAESTAPEETSPAPAEAQDEPLAQEGRPRDNLGRWVAKANQPGEAIDPSDPAPKPKISETPEASAPDPAADKARSNQAPEHWSAEDKATFAKLPPEGQSFLLKRHGDMEAEFTRKSQASAGAVQFAQALVPVFNDPQIAGTLKQMGLNPAQAVHEWAGFHKRATSPNQQDKFSLLVDLTQRMGLDPARIFAALQNQSPPLPPGMSEADLKDPALKYFADQFGRTKSELDALKGEWQQMRANEQKAREEYGVQSARQGIDGFADEKGQDGKPLRPYFDTVLPLIIDLFRANPQRNIAEAYETACWAHPEVRKQLLAADQQRAQSQADIAKARAAQRGNTRGATAPAARPNGADTGSTKGSLRDAIERSADQIGY